MAAKKTPTLLLVDDKPDNLYALRQVIIECLPERCEVLTATTAEDGLAIAVKTHLDGALIDVQMPRVDGIEMCRRLRADAATATVPVILVTAHVADAKLKAKGLEAGAIDFVGKPIDNVELIARIHVMLRITRAEDALLDTNKELERRVRERTEELRQYEHIVSNATDMLALIDRRYVYRAANAAYLQAFAKASDEVIGRTVAEVFGEEFFSTVIRPRAERCLAGEDVRYQEWFDFPTAGRKYMDITYAPYLGPDSEVQGLVVAGRDITGRKLAEEKLEEESHMRMALLDSIPGCIAMILKKGTREIVASNRLAREVGAVPGQTCFSKCAARDDPCPFCLAPKLWETGQPQRLEVEYRRTWYEGVWVPLSEDLYVHYVFDISGRKRLEAQYLQAQKMEAVGQLAGGVAHDFRNQLQVIKGFGAMLLRHGQVAEEGRDKMEDILAAADRSARLTGQLLAFSRREMLRPEIIDPAELIRDMKKSLPQMIGEDIRLSVDVGHDADRVEVDPGQFQQALINLAVNARDAMPQGGELVIATENVDLDAEFVAPYGAARAGKYVMVSVRDTGAGMDPEIRSHVFDPFFTTKEAGKGTGLGLSMVYGFAKQSDGIITCDSEPGKGATFKLYFPAVDTPVAKPGFDEGAAAGIRNATGTILLVEDEDAVRRMLAAELAEAGYTVLQSGHPDAALAMLSEHQGHVDVLITDVVMPGMSGVALAEKVVALRPDVKVLYVSGHVGEELSRRGLEAIRDSILLKPFSFVQLLDRVSKMLPHRTEP